MTISTQTRTDFTLAAMTEAFNKVREKFQFDKSNSEKFALWLRNFSGMAEVHRLESESAIFCSISNTVKIQSSDVDEVYEKAIVKIFEYCDYALDNLEGILTASELIEHLESIV